MVQMEKISEDQQKQRFFKRCIQANIVFSDHNGVFTTEILRRKGDYLSFMKFYSFMFQHFNKEELKILF